MAGVDRWLDPELATLVHDRFSDRGWIYERKFDGERCLCYRDEGQVRLLTRNQLRVNDTYPELSEAALAMVPPGCVIDGEVVAFAGRATSFSRLQERLGVRHPDARLVQAVPVFYYVFDILYADGNDVRDLPLRARKRMLRETVRFGPPLRFATHRNRDGEAYWDYACRNGWEGLIAKRADAPYRGGRSKDWLKFKCENSQEFVIAGFTDPRGSRLGFGALLLGYYEDGKLSYAGKVGTGFDQAALTALHREMQKLQRKAPALERGTLPRSGVHWIEPRLVAQVSFSEWTGSGSLRHPRFQGLRRDKDASLVTRERAGRARP